MDPAIDPGGEAPYYPTAIDLDRIQKHKINVFEVGSGVQVVVIATADGLKVIRDLCTHMGGPLSQGRYCRRAQTLQCPWHGYVFSLRTCEILENPNVRLWEGSQAEYRTFKPERTPTYRLISMKYKIENRRLRVAKAP